MYRDINRNYDRVFNLLSIAYWRTKISGVRSSVAKDICADNNGVWSEFSYHCDFAGLVKRIVV